MSAVPGEGRDVAATLRTLRHRAERGLPPFVQAVNRNVNGSVMDLIRILIAILVPPLGVFLQVGLGKQFWINLLLTLLGYFPGIIHAVWVIAKY